MTTKQNTIMANEINMLHVLIIAPMLLWIAYKLQQGQKIGDFERTSLWVLGLAALVYHGYKWAM